MRSGPLLLLLTLLAACGDDDGGPRPLKLTLTFDAMNGCFTCTGIDSCPMDCSGEIGLFLIDPRDETVIDSKCVKWNGVDGDTLTTLPDLIRGQAFTKGITSGREVAMEISVYLRGTDAENCPRAPVFGVDGMPPDPTAQLPQYFGRSATVTIGDSGADIVLPMTCVLDQGNCADLPDQGTETVHVYDLNLGSNIPPEPATAAALAVGLGDVFYFQPPLATFNFKNMLTYQAGPEPVWTANVVEPVFDPFCVATLVNFVGPGGGHPLVSCHGAVITDDFTGLQLGSDSTGYYLDKARIDAILTGLGLTAVPATGLLIGKVVDDVGNAVDGATVAPLSGSASIIYLDDSFAPAAGTETTSSGWFAVKDPAELEPFLMQPGGGEATRCCDYFLAQKDALVGCSPGRLGTIEGVIMISPVNIEKPCESTP